MNQDRPGIKLYQDVFTSAQTGAHRLALDEIWQRFGDRPAHAGLVDNHPCQGVTCCNGVNSSPGCLDFWEFWHV
jgi:hypothetical protein